MNFPRFQFSNTLAPIRDNAFVILTLSTPRLLAVFRHF
ncbi:hypothetical protein AD16_5380 [Escherichia coli 3-267-03_S4_C2]|nr:hypothetical protein AD16_5380 [Escherichia coli 3-267-03_S4_C2]KEL73862.1 hypothetical protein AC22_5401 [Escherichia coli 5-366-08_S3_C2]